MAKNKKYKEYAPIPPGWDTITGTFAVKGIKSYQENAKVALKDKFEELTIFLTPEPHNMHDKNAIAVYIKRKMFFFLNTDFIVGYLPASLAEVLCYHNLQDKAQPRIRSVYDSETGVKILLIELVAPNDLMTDEMKTHLDECEY